MNAIALINELRDDADLLARSDRWLTEQRTSIAQKISLMLDDLRALNTVMKYKRRLQQTNRVAVRHYEMYNGRPVDDVMSIMTLPDAVSVIRRESSPNRCTNQLRTWMLDGYDVDTASQMHAQ